MSLRVVLVDDHAIVRQGIRALLAAHEDITVVGEAASAKDAVAEVDLQRPDVVLMDVRLADGSGISATREIRERHQGVQILMLTSYDDEEALISSVIAGAAGYVLKLAGSDELVPALRAVGQGQSLIDPRVAGKLLDRIRGVGAGDPDAKPGTLSAREEEILVLLSKGMTNPAIAKELGLATKTVRNYVSSILGKAGARTRTEAAYLLQQKRNSAGEA
jgi:two-component system response regulator DevR